MAADKKRKNGMSHSRTRAGREAKVTNRVLEALLVLTGGLAQDRKAAGAERIQAMGDTLRDLGRSLSDFPEARKYLGFAVESMEGLAEYVSETELSQMVTDAGVFAKRHPLTVMSIGVATGLAATQLLRSDTNAPAARSSRTAGRRKVGRRPAQSRQTKGKANGTAHANA